MLHFDRNIMFPRKLALYLLCFICFKYSILSVAAVLLVSLALHAPGICLISMAVISSDTKTLCWRYDQMYELLWGSLYPSVFSAWKMRHASYFTADKLNPFASLHVRVHCASGEPQKLIDSWTEDDSGLGVLELFVFLLNDTDESQESQSKH